MKNTNPYNDLGIGEKPFSKVVSLDPSYTVSAWKRLNKSTWAIEVALLPFVLHNSLVKTIKSSSALAKR